MEEQPTSDLPTPPNIDTNRRKGEPRSFDDHPIDRISDKPLYKRAWYWLLRLRQDFWLLAITVIVLYALQQNAQRVQDNKERIAEIAALTKKVDAAQKATKAFAIAINTERTNNIRDNCEKTNERGDGSRKALRIGSDIDQKNAPNAAARKEIRRRRDVTISLLDALAPHQDCGQLVRDQVATSDQALKPGATPTPTPTTTPGADSEGGS